MDYMSLATTALSAGASLFGGKKNNEATGKRMTQQLNWQERMDNSKYQRSVEDLRLAGLNPMLAYTNGVGAPPTPAVLPSQDEVTPAVNSANTARLVAAQMKNLDAQSEQAIATAANQEAMQRSNTANAVLTENENAARYGDNGSLTTSDGLTVTAPNLNMLDIQKRMADIAQTKSQTEFVNGQLPKTLAEIENLIKTNDFTAAQTAYTKLQAEATRLGLGKIKAESDAYGSAVGALLPFIPGISSMTNSASGAADTVRKFKSLKGR